MSVRRTIVEDPDLFTTLVTGQITSDEPEYTNCCTGYVLPVNEQSLFGKILISLSAHLLHCVEDQTVQEGAIRDFQRGLPPQWQALLEYYMDVFIETNTRIRPAIFTKKEDLADNVGKL